MADFFAMFGSGLAAPPQVALRSRPQSAAAVKADARAVVASALNALSPARAAMPQVTAGPGLPAAAAAAVGASADPPSIRPTLEEVDDLLGGIVGARLRSQASIRFAMLSFITVATLGDATRLCACRAQLRCPRRQSRPEYRGDQGQVPHV